ncbi:MAG: hypothetical protein CSA65_01485 [Proteobacteria bacterium]|nr:MAG: hypothetical protein CSB49_03155 [Pseudomonadota bacterium]PIE19683.1 MAG: hypothetical protein CSA65_01485 [Pseudomonadota bacterium]
MKQLIAYLLEHIILDFDGDLTLDKVREFLKSDDSRESKLLLARLVRDGGVDDMMIVLADCLVEFVPKGVTPDVVADQLMTYVES